MYMFLKLFFKQLSISKQANYLKKKGVMLGIRIKNGRKVYTYMLRDLFVEVIYKNDNVEQGPEKLNMLSGLKNLNSYLENEFKTSF
jgi:hypothetical protein